MALALAEAGADIVAVDVEPLAAVSDAVTDRGVRCATRELDLRALTPDAAADLMAWSRSRFEDISVLVNNAGMIRRAPAAETSAEDWHDVIGLNLTTPFFLAQAFARPLLRDGATGSIINVVSMNSFQGGMRGAGVHRVQARPPRRHARAGERMDRARDPGERHRSRMDVDRADGAPPRGSRSRRSAAGADADRALGRAGRPRGRRRLSGVGRVAATSRAASSPWTEATLPDSRARAGLAHGPGRAPARAHFRAMGIDPDRLDGPVVGIASTWTGTMPCNLTQRELAAQVAEAVTAAGGVPLEFNTIAVSDNQSQGDAGHARVARLARGDRRLDRADGPRARLRRGRLPGGLRQDDAGGADGPRARGQACGRPLQRADARRAAGRPRRHDPGRRGRPSGRSSAGASAARTSMRSSATRARGRAPAPATSRRTRWRWRSTASASRSSATALIPADDREAKAGAAARAGRLATERAEQRPGGARVPRSPGPAQRHGRGGGDRRLHQRAAAPPGHRPRGGRGR